MRGKARPQSGRASGTIPGRSTKLSTDAPNPGAGFPAAVALRHVSLALRYEREYLS